MVFISNAFSLSMVSHLRATSLAVVPLSPELAARTAAFASGADNLTSIVGHASTASLFARILGVAVIENRVSIELRTGDVLLVGQYSGPRLPEGAIELPEGASVQWFLVSYTT